VESLRGTNLLRKLLGDSLYTAANEVTVHGWKQRSREFKRSVVKMMQKG